MAKKTQAEAAAPAPEPESEQTALATDAFDFEFESDGLEEVDAQDIKFPVKAWNIKGKRNDGSNELHRVDEFFDTITEKVQRELWCIFVVMHKTLNYSYFDNGKQETVRVCGSYDRLTGRLRMAHPETNQPEGLERLCETCPDQQWRQDEKGKRSRNCSDIYGVIGVELEDEGRLGQPFMIRFKRTSLKPFQQHLQKYHLNKRRLKTGRLGHEPLFKFTLRVKLEADQSGNFATPVFYDVRPITDPALARELAEQARMFREMATDITKAAENREAEMGSEVVNTSGESVTAADFADS